MPPGGRCPRCTLHTCQAGNRGLTRHTLHPIFHRDSPNRLQSLMLNDDQIRAEYSTASPISFPCLPSWRSTSSSLYSPLMCGTLMVMSMSALYFSSRSRVMIKAVKSGAEAESLPRVALGVWVEMRV